MCKSISQERWCFVEVPRVFRSCKEAELEIRQQEGIKKILGGSGKLLVPKTMIVGNKRDNFSRLALVTSYEYEKYSGDEVARSLGYEVSEGMWITHKEVDTVSLIGRESGECSVILDDLDRFNRIIFSQRLEKDLKRKNGVVAYALGNKVFWCGGSFEFMQQFMVLSDRIGVGGIS